MSNLTSVNLSRLNGWLEQTWHTTGVGTVFSGLSQSVWRGYGGSGSAVLGEQAGDARHKFRSLRP